MANQIAINNSILRARGMLDKTASVTAQVGLNDQALQAGVAFINARHAVLAKTASEQPVVGTQVLNKLASRNYQGLKSLCICLGYNKTAAEAAEKNKGGDGKGGDGKGGDGQGGNGGKQEGFITQKTKDDAAKAKQTLAGAGDALYGAAQKGVNGSLQWLLNPTTWKQIGVGLGTGGGLYGLSWLLPNAKNTHLARILASIVGGGVAGYYGDNIINAITGDGWKSDAELREQAQNKA